MTTLEAWAVRIHRHGGPEEMRLETVAVPPPGPGQVRLRQTAIGLNFIDTYHRSGLYPLELPATLGNEGAGVVESVGDGVEGLAVGDRVAYAMAPGAYAEARLLDAARAVRLPGDIADETAAAILLKGLTAHYLLHRVHAVAAGDTVLIHAAAGGVGSILCPWAKALGARVIGTAGSEEKAARARAGGCDAVILYRHEDIAERVRALTDGRGVEVVYDGVGRATFDASLASVAVHGLVVAFGNASGPVPPFDLLRLAPKGAFVTRPSLATYAATREDLTRAAEALFAAVSAGTVPVEIGRRLPLAEAAAAHRALEARETVGSTVLYPPEGTP